MKKIHFVLIFVLVLSLNACNTIKQNSQDSDLPIIESAYFGQNLPGMTAKIFVPDIVSVNGRYEYAVSFSPDLEEMYFSGEREGEVQKGKCIMPRIKMANIPKYTKLELNMIETLIIIKTLDYNLLTFEIYSRFCKMI